MGIYNYYANGILAGINDMRRDGKSIRCKIREIYLKYLEGNCDQEIIETRGPIGSGPDKDRHVNTFHIDDPMHKEYTKRNTKSCKKTILAQKFVLIYEYNLGYLTDIFLPNLGQKGLFGN